MVPVDHGKDKAVGGQPRKVPLDKARPERSLPTRAVLPLHAGRVALPTSARYSGEAGEQERGVAAGVGQVL